MPKYNRNVVVCYLETTGRLFKVQATDRDDGLMKKVSVVFAAVVLVGLCAAAAIPTLPAQSAPLVPLKYEVQTNYSRYARNVALTTNLATTFFHVEETNFPAAVVHSVTWGRDNQPVFILKSQELLPQPADSTWYRWDLKYYNAATWIEVVR